MLVTERYPKITYRAQKRVPCAGGCDRMLKRAKTFWKTSNPFNNYESRESLTAKMRTEAEAWMKEPEYCQFCDEPTIHSPHGGNL